MARSDFTALRDILHKRIQRAIKSGRDLTGTALERYVTGEPGEYKENLPKVADLRRQAEETGAKGEALDSLVKAKMDVLRGKLQRTLAARTGSLKGIVEHEKNNRERQFEIFLNSRGLDDLSGEENLAVQRAIGIARAMHVDAIDYKKVMDAAGQIVNEGKRGFSDRDIINRVLTNEMLNPDQTQIKQSVSLISNIYNTRGRDAEMAGAINRLSNALRKYGGR